MCIDINLHLLFPHIKIKTAFIAGFAASLLRTCALFVHFLSLSFWYQTKKTWPGTGTATPKFNSQFGRFCIVRKETNSWLISSGVARDQGAEETPNFHLRDAPRHTLNQISPRPWRSAPGAARDKTEKRPAHLNLASRPAITSLAEVIGSNRRKEKPYKIICFKPWIFGGLDKHLCNNVTVAERPTVITRF